MTETRLWLFSIHSQSRCASRLKLLMDEKTRIEISNRLDNGATLVTKSHGRHVFEIEVFGTKTIAVCDVEQRTVVTLIEAKRWYKKIKHGKGRNMRKQARFRDSFDQEREIEKSDDE